MNVFSSASEFTSNLLDAVAIGDYESVHCLLSKTNHKFTNHLDDYGNNVLHWCASADSEALVAILITQYCAQSCINMKNRDGEVPLHWHIKHGCKVGVACLLYYGADASISSYDTPNGPGMTPLQLAFSCRNDDIIKLLYSYGCRKLA